MWRPAIALALTMSRSMTLRTLRPVRPLALSASVDLWSAIFSKSEGAMCGGRGQCRPPDFRALSATVIVWCFQTFE